MKLHEIELYAGNPEKEKGFYAGLLGLPLKLDQTELKVYDTGVPGIDFNISTHNPEPKISLSFLVNDVAVYHTKLVNSGVEVTPPYDAHLGLKEIEIIHHHYRIVIHSPTGASPEWLKNMV